MISMCQVTCFVNVKLLTLSRYELSRHGSGAACPSHIIPNWFYWLELQSSISLNSQLYHSIIIIILWLSESHREEILPSFCLFLLGFI